MQVIQFSEYKVQDTMHILQSKSYVYYALDIMHKYSYLIHSWGFSIDQYNTENIMHVMLC